MDVLSVISLGSPPIFTYFKHSFILLFRLSRLS